MKRIRVDHSINIALEGYRYYMFWAAVILAISFAVRIAVAVFVSEAGVIEVRAATVMRGFSQVFALVVGIINGVYAIRYFVRQGVTRHSFYLGGIVTGLAIALTLQIVAAVVATAARLLSPVLPIQVVAVAGGAGTGPLVSVLLVVSLFLIGWIIGFTFSRFGVFAGLASIVAGLLVHGMLTSIWGENVHISIMGIAIPSFDGITAGAALATTVLLAVVQLGALYLLVRDTPLRVQ